MKNLVSLSTICKNEGAYIYGVDSALMLSTAELRTDDIKVVNMIELLNTKTTNSYINLESASSYFYFVPAKVISIKTKKPQAQNTQAVNTSRMSLNGPQINFKAIGNTDDRPTVKKIRADASPQHRSRIESNNVNMKSYSPFVSNVRKTDSLLKQDSDKKGQIARGSKFNEHNSEIVNIYRKPLYGKLSRVKQHEHDEHN